MRTLSDMIESIADMIRTKRANGNGSSRRAPDRKSRRRGGGAPLAAGSRSTVLCTSVGGSTRRLRSGVCGRWLCAASLWACLLAQGPAQTAAAETTALPEPQPLWVRPDASVRYVFTMPYQLRYCLVKLPATLAAGQPVAQVTAFAGDRDLPLRVLHADAREIAVMVNATYVAAGSPVAVYAAGGATPVPVGDAGPLDPAPVFGEVRKVLGQDLPKTWAAHQFQRRRVEAPFRTFRAVSFDHAQREGNPRQWRREEWSRSGYCMEYSTWVRVPVAGTYRFAVRGADAVFLLWGEDADPVVEHAEPARRDEEGGEPERKWFSGRELHLEAGVYPLRTVQVSRRWSDAQPGWITPGGTEIVEIPVENMLSGQRRLPALRREAIGGIVHAAFEDDVGAGYRFRGIDGVFAPVRLKALSTDWSGGEPENRWSLAGVEAFCGTEWNTVLPSGTHAVALTARNTLGFEGRVVQNVRVTALATQEYRVAGSLQGVPSVCYDGDRVWPDLWVTGSVPSDVLLQCRLNVRLHDGRTRLLEGDVSLVLGWGRLRGAEVSAGDVDAVEWEIRHGGVLLAQQTVRFMRQPFQRLPDHVVGTELRSDGDRVVLVVRRVSMDDAPLAVPSRTPSRILCLDSTLAPPGWYAGGQDAAYHEVLGTLLSNGHGAGAVPTVERWVYEDLADDPEGGLRAFAPLGGLDHFRAGDLVVISLGLEAYVDREPVGAFERRLAGLCGLLREVVHADVVLVTPPPFGDDRKTMRPYAEAVLRVADAYGLVVADVYSAFGGHALPQRLYDGLRVTDEGQALAAGVVARALRSYRRGGP